MTQHRLSIALLVTAVLTLCLVWFSLKGNLDRALAVQQIQCQVTAQVQTLAYGSTPDCGVNHGR